MVFRGQVKVLHAFFLSAVLLISVSRLMAKESNHTVTLNIEPKPVSAMKELTFSLTVTPSDKLPDKLLLDLSMPGMQMGKNQVTLVKKSTNTYEGKGIIVRCMSRQTLWQITILSDELKNPAFTFNVTE